jgi:hypothetical protein
MRVRRRHVVCLTQGCARGRTRPREPLPLARALDGARVSFIATEDCRVDAVRIHYVDPCT